MAMQRRSRRAWIVRFVCHSRHRPPCHLHGVFEAVVRELETITYERDGIRITIPSYMANRKEDIIDYIFRRLAIRLTGGQ